VIYSFSKYIEALYEGGLDDPKFSKGASKRDTVLEEGYDVGKLFHDVIVGFEREVCYDSSLSKRTRFIVSNQMMGNFLMTNRLNRSHDGVFEMFGYQIEVSRTVKVGDIHCVCIGGPGRGVYIEWASVLRCKNWHAIPDCPYRTSISASDNGLINDKECMPEM
jgi:hypothetical protein